MNARTPAGGAAYERIYRVVECIPSGKVATYGQVARLAGECTARMVGYALARLPAGRGVPWQRVVNAQGRISPHGQGTGSLVQQKLLAAEGVRFQRGDRIDLARYRWNGR